MTLFGSVVILVLTLSTSPKSTLGMVDQGLGRMLDPLDIMDDAVPIPEHVLEEEIMNVGFETRGTPKAVLPNLCIRVKLFYNKRFKDFFDANTNIAPSADAAAKTLFQKANAVFASGGFWSNVKLILVQDPIYEPDPEANWEVTPSDYYWLQHSSIQSKTSANATINHFAFLTFDPTFDGLVGMAYIRTACHKSNFFPVVQLFASQG